MTEVFGIGNLHDAAIAHNSNPVTHGQQFVVIGTDQYDAPVLGGYFINQVKQGYPGSDVNALGWFIENKKIRL